MSVGCLMNMIQSTLLSILLLMQLSRANAVKMDETTHDQVIQRLEMGLDGMDKTDPERTGIALRLADLYADRARLKAMNEVQNGCQDCKGAQDDRKKAIVLYQEVLPKSDKAQQGKVLLQIAHLYALSDDMKKSGDLYAQILKSKNGQYSSEVKALAYLNVAEVKFRNADFKGALKDFESARREKLNARALVEYRLAWCHLNLGHTDKAIASLVALLKDPETLATQTTDGKTVDPSFVVDVSHDLAVFLAHSKVGTRQIELLKQLSPDSARKSNLHTLATETDRLGQKSSSLIVWAAYVDDNDVKSDEKLEVQARVAQIYYDMNQQEFAATSFEKIMDMWTKLGCKDEAQCKDLKARLRKFVVAWNKGQKKAPSEFLFRVYDAYNRTFPHDAEMLQWEAIVARDLKKHKESAALFHQACEEAQVELKKNPSNKDMRAILDASILTEIEMAEKSGDPKAREKAYNYYLQFDPNGSRAFEVRYQRAQVFYSSNRFQEAFSEFHYLASQPTKDNRDLRIKSADLALDCLVALKDDKSLQVRSLEYARLFPERKTEYLKISRKATMTLVANNVKNQKSTDHGDYKADLAALSQVNMDGADDAEKIKFYKNKLTVAQKAMDLNSVKDSAGKLLAIKSLSGEDREWTMAQQVWVAELQLAFAEAYQISKKMNLKELSKPDRELRLALLAELAGEDSRKHNENYVSLTPDTRKSNLVRVTLIKTSHSPWMELERQAKHFRGAPDLLAGLTLEVYAGHPDNKRAEHMLRSTPIARYATGQALQRHMEMKDFSAFDKKLHSHRVYGYNDAVIKRTLKERLNLLGQAEKHAQTAVRKHDWTMEVLTLSELARENRRLYQDILALPVPHGLKAQDRARYQQLLRTQSQPYLTRAEKIEAELGEMWGNSNSVQNLQAAYMTATPEMQKFYRDEIIPLAQIAPSGAKNRLQNLLNTPYRRPSQRDVLLARRELQQSPFDISKAERLRELESQNGRPAMVVYLDERISQLKKGKSL